VKIVSLFLCSIFIFFLTQAQNRFIGGLLLNINGIEFKGRDEAVFWNLKSTGKEIGGTLGFSAGLFVKREFTKKIYSTLEFRYIKKGSIYGFISQYGTQSFETLCLNYIELPVLFGYKIKPHKRIFYIESGFAFAKLISSNIARNELINRIGTPNANDFKHIDISWIGSLKFPLIRKWKNFLFGLRVSHSIVSVHKYYKIYNFDYGIEFNYIFN
jgi:hypothetical protein